MSTLLAPRLTHDLVGHEAAIEEVRAAFASGRMPHAWMLSGIDGIGKTSLAWHIANHVLSNGKNPIGKFDATERTTRLIQGEAHPDLFVLRRTVDDKTGELRSVIAVDDARKIATFLSMTSTHGGWRVVIIDEAHLMNSNSENAILKILEEPPAHALILMTVTTPGAMLPTIRSRCRVLQLAPLSDAHMRTVLMRTALDLGPDEINRLIAISGGSAGFALKIARSEALPLHDEMLAIIGAFPALDVPRLHKLADQINRKADIESFEVLRTLLLDRLRGFALSNAKSNPALAGESVRVLDRLKALFDSAENVNLDRKLAFIRAISDLRASA